MSLTAFLKKNKIKKENVFFPVSASFTGEDGKPVPWELRAVPPKEIGEIEAACLRETPAGKNGGKYRQVTDSSFMARICAAAVVYPDLYNAELQDSYGVTTPHELLLEMVDNYGEYKELIGMVTELCGMNRSLYDEAEQAKN